MTHVRLAVCLESFGYSMATLIGHRRAARWALHDCFMCAQAAQRFVPRMQKLGIAAGALCNVAFTMMIMRQQQAQSAQNATRAVSFRYSTRRQVATNIRQSPACETHCTSKENGAPLADHGTNHNER